MSDQHEPSRAPAEPAAPAAGRSQAPPPDALGSSDFPEQAFTDVLRANAAHSRGFTSPGLGARAARGLAIITCMDSRIDPLAVVGMGPGDVKILRNAGARVTEDVLRTLVLACYLLEVDRVLVMPHTRCRMVGSTEQEIHALIQEKFGVDTSSIEFATVQDQQIALRRDIRRIRSYPLLPDGLVVAGAVYDVDTGALHRFEG
jgi:carbonic anhydrase